VTEAIRVVDAFERPSGVKQPGLFPTLVACTLLVASFLVAVASLTDGFERWTFEALRREAAREGRLQLPAILLRDSDDRRFTVERARVHLVDFIYTRCASVCQALGAEFHQAQEALRRSDGAGVGLLSVSIDPDHDDSAKLNAYARRFRVDAKWWTVAAPVSPLAGRRAMRELGVVAVPDGLGGFVHNGAIHVVDADGRVRGIFDYADWPSAVAAAQALAGARR
jgi:protein SCO1/2